MDKLISLNSNRTSRLARRLVGSDREGVFYDVQERKKYTYFNRGLALDKYVDRPDIFGSFTSLPKLGINPSTKYNTPIGIYAYPIRYLVGLYDETSAEFDVPFAGDAEYLHIFTVKDLGKALKFDPDFDEDVRRVQGAAENFPVSNTQGAAIDKVLKKARVYVQEHANKNLSDDRDSWNWYEYFMTGLKSPVGAGIGQFHPDIQKAILDHFTFDKMLKYNLPSPGDEGGIEGFRPSHVFNKIIHDISMNQAVEETFFPYEGQLRSLPDVKALNEEEYKEHKKKALESDQMVECDTAFIWNFLRLFANSNKVKWTDYMRQMGFIGAVDYGTGTIHENEETQAVFFNPSSIKVIEVMHNKTPQQHMGRGSENESLLGQWAETPQKGIKGALAFLKSEINDLNQIGDLFSKGGYAASKTADFKAGLIRTMKYIGWLNLHVKNNPEWSSVEKGQAESGVKEAMAGLMSYFNSAPFRKKLLEGQTMKEVQDLYVRVMRSLGRR